VLLCEPLCGPSGARAIFPPTPGFRPGLVCFPAVKRRAIAIRPAHAGLNLGIAAPIFSLLRFGKSSGADPSPEREWAWTSNALFSSARDGWSNEREHFRFVHAVCARLGMAASRVRGGKEETTQSLCSARDGGSWRG